MEAGDVAVRREVWRGQPYSAIATTVIEDTPDLLAVHVPVGAALGFVPDHPLGVHAWSDNDSWQGIDVVMLQRPHDSYSVWFFGEFAVYLNLQEPFRRTAKGFDTFDHELDVVVAPDGQWQFKDEERLDPAVESGKYSAAEVASIRTTGDMLAAMLDAGETWWDPDWAAWAPPPSWPLPTLPTGWAD